VRYPPDRFLLILKSCRQKPALINQKIKFAEAIRYTQSHRIGLIPLVEDGRIEMGANIFGRSIRLISTGLSLRTSLSGARFAKATRALFSEAKALEVAGPAACMDGLSWP
jgi:hypothetical protein